MKSPSVRQTNAAKKWGRWENYLAPYLDNPRVIVDVGANIGYSSIFFARNFPEAVIFALEPVQDNFDCLLENIRDCDGIIPYNVAAGRSEGSLVLSLLHNAEKNLGMMSVYGNGTRAETVPMFPLDELCGLATVDFIKIDVEGYEYDVLRGADGVLAKHRPIIQMEVNDEAHEYLLTIGYKDLIRWHGDYIYEQSST